jgi:hypothetical protein
MPDELKQIETPQWMLDLFKAIDTLDTSEDGGFKIFDENITLCFGPIKTTVGRDACKKFFADLDGPFLTHHGVDVVYQHGDSYFMQGNATIRSPNDPPEKGFTVRPLYNIMWFNKEGKIMRYVVEFPPDAKEKAGL